MLLITRVFDMLHVYCNLGLKTSFLLQNIPAESSNQEIPSSTDQILVVVQSFSVQLEHKVQHWVILSRVTLEITTNNLIRLLQSDLQQQKAWAWLNWSTDLYVATKVSSNQDLNAWSKQSLLKNAWDGLSPLQEPPGDYGICSAKKVMINIDKIARTILIEP